MTAVTQLSERWQLQWQQPGTNPARSLSACTHLTLSYLFLSAAELLLLCTSAIDPSAWLHSSTTLSRWYNLLPTSLCFPSLYRWQIPKPTTQLDVTRRGRRNVYMTRDTRGEFKSVKVKQYESNQKLWISQIKTCDSEGVGSFLWHVITNTVSIPRISCDSQRWGNTWNEARGGIWVELTVGRGGLRVSL